MSELHEKINEEHLQGRTTLLTTEEESFVHVVENKAQEFHESFLTIKAKEKAAQDMLSKLAEQNEIAASLCDHIRNKVFFSTSDDLDIYKQDVISKLKSLKDQATKTEVKAFLNQLIHECSSAEGDRYDIEDAYSVVLDNMLIEFFEGLDDGESILVDHDALQELFDNSVAQNNILADCEGEISHLLVEVDLYKGQTGHNFDLDKEFRLAKISRKDNPIDYSVLYVGARTDPEDRQAYVLYRGKEQILGKGKNGLFKLCQNLQTGDWAAVKILSEETYRDSEFETEVLDEVGRLYGVNGRNDKQYIVQELLNGKELTIHLVEDESPSLESRINIAKQAIALVKEFNTQFLHRDIKPDNFIWDARSQTLYLCDFGYSCKLDFESYDLAGSPGFIAPEIENHEPNTPVPYSIKSETYALGNTLECIFAGLENVPDEISEIISEMSASDPEKRFVGDYDELLTRIDEIDLAHDSSAQFT